MKRIALLFLFISTLVPAFGQDKGKEATIRFPTIVTPTPKPMPLAVTKLTDDMLYVIDSDVPIAVLSSPENIVSVTPETGPLRVRAKFVDGTGSVETRQFNGKFLSIVEAKGQGTVELIVVPFGLTKVSDIIRKTIDVDGGQAPQPPPNPGPKPDPTPNPTATKIQIVTFDDFQKRPSNVEMSLLLGDVGYWKTVRDAGHKFRSYDISNPAAAAWKQWWKDSGGAGIPPPLVVFTDASAPYRFLGAEPMPTSKDGMDKLIKKYSGVK